MAKKHLSRWELERFVRAYKRAYAADDALTGNALIRNMLHKNAIESLLSLSAGVAADRIAEDEHGDGIAKKLGIDRVALSAMRARSDEENEEWDRSSETIDAVFTRIIHELRDELLAAVTENETTTG